jgi:putative ABC transport system ATP-binding protein
MTGGGGALVSVESVSKEYAGPAGRIRVLDRVDLEVEPGTSCAIIGPSGCGKSTLLALLGGLDVPTSGRVVVDGVVLSSLRERERTRWRRANLGIVLQSDDLMPFLTLSENVAQRLAMHGRSEAWARAQQMLDRLGIGELASRLPDQVSGGQRQRAALARALVVRPRLVLADEPTGALDPETSSAVVRLLLGYQAREGASLVVVTHDLEVAQHMELVLDLREGRVAVEDAHAG